MICGRPYDAEQRLCYGCGEKKPQHPGECHDCGEPGCDACMEFRQGATDQLTGYCDTGLMCGECIEKRKEDAA